MSKDEFTWYLKECLLEAKQTLAHVCNPPKKLAIGDKIKQPRVVGLGYLIMPFGMKKCKSQHVLLHPKR